jgi:cytoskeletal protein CcmA (bactofilin family)
MEGKMMEEYPLSDLVINGVSGAAGGTYENVRIEGVGKVSGTIVARRFNGNGHIRLKADITADELECNGTMNVKGNMKFGNMKADGLLTIGGAVSGESCELNGMMSIKGDCELEHFTGNGGFTVGGLLSAGQLDFCLQGQGKASEIGVESLVIRQANNGMWNKLFSGIIPKLKPELRVGVIEGDYIDIEYTNADIVRGNVVIIGQGCSIGRVEYRSKLSVHPGATIMKEEKVND